MADPKADKAETKSLPTPAEAAKILAAAGVKVNMPKFDDEGKPDGGENVRPGAEHIFAVKEGADGFYAITVDGQRVELKGSAK